MSDKTEKPTERRIRKAREEGQVVKSQEINAVVQMGLILLWMFAEGNNLYSALGGFISMTIDSIAMSGVDATTRLTGELARIVVRFVFGLATLLSVSLMLTGLIQSGFLFAPKAIHPSLQRINMLSNAKQMVSMTKVFDLFKMLLKVGILGATFAYLIKRYAASFSHLPQAKLEAGLVVATLMAQWMWAILLAVTAVFAVADYVMQYNKLRKELMMSRHDIEQEVHTAEGNPKVKQRRREMHREVQSGSLAGKVAKSSVVVRNPTHIAVCLRYEEGETPLPQVLAYGCDALALKIVALAEQQGIPVVENVPLARALFVSTQPGDYIPETLIAAVAQILRTIRDALEQQNDPVKHG